MESKYIIDTEENRKFARQMAEDLLDFGRQFPSLGGSAWYLGDDGSPWTDRPRETYATARMAHSYSLGALLGYKDSAVLAKAATDGLRGELRDEDHGGWYAGLTGADNAPLSGKQCYTHAFVILAASSAALAGIPGAEELLQDALHAYARWFWDEREGLAVDTWDTEFTVLDPYRGLNANMHSVEAFLAAADVTGDETYRQRAGTIIDRVIGWAWDNNWRIPEHFRQDWTADMEQGKDNPADPFKPYGATPGHGIEWARLIVQWALSETMDADRRQSYVEAAENLYARAVLDAWNTDGAPGLVYTTDWEGKPVVHDRMHWTLAEAIDSAAVLYRVTGKERYAQDYSLFLHYLDEVVLDKATGSWFHQLDRNNAVSGTVWQGKPDLYHALQAALIPYYAPNMSIAAAIRSAGQEGERAQRAGNL